MEAHLESGPCTNKEDVDCMSDIEQGRYDMGCIYHTLNLQELLHLHTCQVPVLCSADQLCAMYSLQVISGWVGGGVWGSAIMGSVLRSSKPEVSIVLGNPLFIPSGILPPSVRATHTLSSQHH